MDIKELTQVMTDLVHVKGWDDQLNTQRPQTLRNLAISLSLEANEVLELFQWSDELKDKEALSEELADVALYLLQLAQVGKIDLEQAILSKVNQNYLRTWDEPDEEGQA
jgi:NTP pyrophosphatase (non-canonical NTP hydrolase)